MKRLFLIGWMCLSVLLSVQAKTSIELDSIVCGSYDPIGMPALKAMNNPALFSYLDDNQKIIWSCDFATGKKMEKLLDLSEAKGNVPEQIVGYALSPVENRILVWTNRKPIYRRSFIAEYYVYDRKRNTMEALSENGPQRDARFSPDGRSVAFARDNNLFIKRLDFGTEVQVTTDGVRNAIINGVTDWVYEEEFMTTCAYDWSPDSKYLAFVRFDERKVKDYTFPLYGAEVTSRKKERWLPSSSTFKYPSAGEANSIVTVWAFNLQTRSSKQMELPITEEDYIPRIRFTRNNSQLAVMTLNREQNTFRMFFANPRSAQSILILTEQNETYVEPAFDAINFSSNYFTYVSGKDGYRHLYLYGPQGGLVRQLTSGSWDLIRFLGADTIRNEYYIQSAEEGATQRDIYRIDFKGRKTKLSLKPGSTYAVFGSDYSWSVQSWSNIRTPKVISVCNRDGEEVRVLESNRLLKNKLAQLRYDDKKFITVPSADGQKLNGWMIKPADFDAKNKYPVVMIQYSGPDAQQVLDEFDFDWEYYLAANGYVVVCVDGRGTGGRGEAFRKSIWSRLGALETEDQLATAAYLKTLSFVDASRIGIWGWSYGGYITLLSMTETAHPFKAGVAVAPVCDYRYYNTVYTERYMRSPKENEAGYERNSPVLRAGALKGRLLLVHGMADDNVRANQSMDFAEALIRSGIQFDMMLYPTSAHSILGETYRRHLYRRMADFWFKNL